MQTIPTETQIRNFLTETLYLPNIQYCDLTDELNLDSLVQTELRIYISESFGIPTDLESMPAETTTNLDSILSYIQSSEKIAGKK
jgi:acyl carrier protein